MIDDVYLCEFIKVYLYYLNLVWSELSLTFIKEANRPFLSDIIDWSGLELKSKI